MTERELEDYVERLFETTKKVNETSLGRLLELARKNAYHIEVLNGETGEIRDAVKSLQADLKVAFKDTNDLKVATSEIKTDVAWLKKSYWVVATASIGGLVAAIFSLFAR